MEITPRMMMDTRKHDAELWSEYEQDIEPIDRIIFPFRYWLAWKLTESRNEVEFRKLIGSQMEGSL